MQGVHRLENLGPVYCLAGLLDYSQPLADRPGGPVAGSITEQLPSLPLSPHLAEEPEVPAL